MNGSWKTKALGVLTILGAVVNGAIGYFKTGQLPDFGALITAITAGIGLLHARQDNVTSEAAGAK